MCGEKMELFINGFIIIIPLILFIIELFNLSKIIHAEDFNIHNNVVMDLSVAVCKCVLCAGI